MDRVREGMYWVSRWFCIVGRHTLKWTVTVQEPLSGTSLEDRSECRSHWGEIWTVYLVVHLAWQKKWLYISKDGRLGWMVGGSEGL